MKDLENKIAYYLQVLFVSHKRTTGAKTEGRMLIPERQLEIKVLNM